MKKIAFLLVLIFAGHSAAQVSRQGTIASDEQRAKIFLEKGDWPNLLTHSTYWIKKYPGEGKAWHYLGIAQKTLGQKEEAIKSLTKAWKLSYQRDYDIISDVGDMYVEQEQWDLAENAYRKALKIKSQSPDMWNRLVDVIFAYPHPSQLNDAAVALKKLLSFPDYVNNPDRWQQYAKTIDELGMDDEVVYDAYRHVLRLLPKNINAYEKMHTIDLIRGDIQEAEKKLSSLLKLDSKNPTANVYFGRQALKNGNPKIAQQYFSFVLEHANLPKRLRAKTLTALGDLHSKKRDFPNALEQYRQSISTDPTYLPPWEQVIAILRNQGNFSDAQKYYEKLLTVERLIARNKTVDDSVLPF
jgi:tetratricopeptide (TPR) repeat protein